MASPLLEARSIHVWRGDRHLLKSVSFELRAGELLQIAGPNGIGKSTLLRVVCDLLPCESGEVWWDGQPIHKQRGVYAEATVYLAHLNALKNDLTALENLRYSVGLRVSVREDELLATLEALGIRACADLPVRALSAGQKRRLALARVRMSKARLWVLDEPTTNLDAAGAQMVETLVREHLAGGGAAIAAAHHFLLQGEASTRKLELS
jgi:heme exporter protein A